MPRAKARAGIAAALILLAAAALPFLSPWLAAMVYLTPVLRDRRRYDFIVHEDERDRGGKAACYEYMIRTEFKDDMSRAEYLHRR